VKFGIGQAIARKEDRRFVTGTGRYLDDIKLDGETRAYVLRSPYAHARIKSIDATAARQAPGVVAVFTGADAAADNVAPLPCLAHPGNKPGTPEQNFPERPTIAKDTVRFVGDPVALVIAETLAQARDAAELIEIDYDSLPAIADLAKAVQDGAPQIHKEAPNNINITWADGDEPAVKAAFDKAHKVVTVDLVNNRVVPNSMEVRGAIASYTDAEGYTLYTSSQGSHLMKDVLLGFVLKGTPPDKLRVVTPDVGGGFGMKIFVYPEYIMCLWAAKKLGRPVRWISDRSEGFLTDTHGRDNITKVQIALDKDAKFLGLRLDTLANLGAYLSQFGPYIPTAAGKGMHVGVYNFPCAYVEVKCVFTNTAPVDAYRGAGRPEAAYVIERVVDAAARAMGIGVDEIRRRNFIPASAMPYTTILGHTYDSGDFIRNMQDAMKDGDWPGFAARKAESAKRGKLRGLGMSYYIEVCGGEPNVPAILRFEPDDTVTVIVGTQSNGQGHETAYSQIVAERLGIDFDKIIVKQGDTAMAPSGSFTGGSRSVPVGGVAAQQSADLAIEKGKPIAADLLEAAASDIEFKDGRYSIAGTDRSVDIFKVAAAAREGRGLPIDAPKVLEASADFKPAAATYPNGCHVVEIEVDPDTGNTELVRYTVVDDFGKVVNPLMLSGQVHGGIGQGVGQALLENAVYDEEGQLIAGSFMDYTMPRADNIPHIDFRWNEIPCINNPLGIKGAGEAGAIGAPPAIINAIVDALSPYGVKHIDMPATPLNVWNTIRAHSARKAAE
jgi:carbon-monoxide dehydrogenase large subunit